MPHDVKVTAHRGSSAAAPENTLAAIERAILDRADCAEIDVQLTADGEVVVLHDANARRVSGLNASVSLLTLAELKQHDVGSWFAPKFTDQRVPTLREVIALVRGRLQLNIELKPIKKAVGLAERVVEVIEREKFEADCVVSSRDDAALARVRQLSPGLRIGKVIKTRAACKPFSPSRRATADGDLLPERPSSGSTIIASRWRSPFARSRRPRGAAMLEVDFLSVKDRFVERALIENAHENGKEVHVWTVNDPARMRTLIAWGADNLITDVPEVLRKLLDQPAEAAEKSTMLPASRPVSP